MRISIPCIGLVGPERGLQADRPRPGAHRHRLPLHILCAHQGKLFLFSFLFLLHNRWQLRQHIMKCSIYSQNWIAVKDIFKDALRLRLIGQLGLLVNWDWAVLEYLWIYSLIQKSVCEAISA